MSPEAFAAMAQSEDQHWWFQVRRSYVAALLSQTPAPPDRQRQILEIGCGSGGNLAMLANFGELTAIEPDIQARERALARAIKANIFLGQLPDVLPVPEASFDVVVLCDVLEHCQDDAAAIKAVSRLCRPGGYVICSVPALTCLWSRHDEIHHHCRRYNAASLRHLFQAHGFHLQVFAYIFCLTLPLLFLSRFLARLRPSISNHEQGLPPSLLNAAIIAVLRCERWFLSWLPCGSSLLVLAQVPGGNSKPQTMGGETVQIGRFGLVGLLCTGLHFLAQWGWCNGLGIPPWLGYWLAFAIAFMASFFFHQRWTFRSSGASCEKIPPYLALQIALQILNYLLFLAILHLLGTQSFRAHSHLIAVAISTTCVTLLGYLGARRVFSRS